MSILLDKTDAAGMVALSKVLPLKNKLLKINILIKKKLIQNSKLFYTHI